MKKLDYIFEVDIKLIERINAKTEKEAKDIWHKKLKKELITEKIDYCPKKKEIKLIDIVLNREANNIYAEDISLFE